VLSGGVRIWLAFEPVDMRRSFDGLAACVTQALGRDPYSGECFVFRGKGGGRLKMLVWDGLGFWIHYRRLERASFVWPQVNGSGAIELSHAQFAVLTQGLDWRRVRVPEPLAVSVT
jgi:transposase